jgi:YD repeat-containing protein
LSRIHGHACASRPGQIPYYPNGDTERVEFRRQPTRSPTRISIQSPIPIVRAGFTDSAGRTTVLGWCGCNAIAQLTDANGTDGTGAVVTSYDYDPWGRVTKIAGGKEAAFGQVLPKSPAPG